MNGRREEMREVSGGDTVKAHVYVYVCDIYIHIYNQNTLYNNYEIVIEQLKHIYKTSVYLICDEFAYDPGINKWKRPALDE